MPPSILTRCSQSPSWTCGYRPNSLAAAASVGISADGKTGCCRLLMSYYFLRRPQAVRHPRPVPLVHVEKAHFGCHVQPDGSSHVRPAGRFPSDAGRDCQRHHPPVQALAMLRRYASNMGPTLTPPPFRAGRQPSYRSEAASVKGMNSRPIGIRGLPFCIWDCAIRDDHHFNYGVARYGRARHVRWPNLPAQYPWDHPVALGAAAASRPKPCRSRPSRRGPVP